MKCARRFLIFSSVHLFPVESFLNTLNGVLRTNCRCSYISSSSEPRKKELLSSYVEETENPMVLSTEDDSTPTNGSCRESCGRYDEVLHSAGLSNLKQVPKLPETRKIRSTDVFCNRELRLGGISAIGFDMDYTLAQYKQPAFDQLAFDGAKRKLIEKLGYPEEVMNFQYDHTHWTRGLIIDTERGNFLKIDRHKYVRVAYHGFDKISSDTRKYLYSRAFNKVPSFSEKQYVNMDTLFQYVDAHLFACLIDLKDKGGQEFLDLKTYREMYTELRECVDLCHRDGVIKDEVARNPAEYLVYDEDIFPMLKRYQDAGVKVFLLTNSDWTYTSVAMNYLYHGTKVDHETKQKNQWLDLFDLVIVTSCKPAYMLDPYLNLFRVRTHDGSLMNTDGLFEIEALGDEGAQKFLEKGNIFQGGNWKHLHSMLQIEAGEEILYVGDHLYSDVLRSKRTLGWRSVFIMPELEEEMRVFHENLPLLKQITSLRKLRDELSSLSDSIQLNAKPGDDLEQSLREIDEDDQKIKEKLTQLTNTWHSAFHPIWGAMFNAGYQDSRFAFYVQNYACLYTAKASNLGSAFTTRSFRTTPERLPHDAMLFEDDTEFSK